MIQINNRWNFTFTNNLIINITKEGVTSFFVSVRHSNLLFPCPFTVVNKAIFTNNTILNSPSFVWAAMAGNDNYMYAEVKNNIFLSDFPYLYLGKVSLTTTLVPGITEIVVQNNLIKGSVDPIFWIIGNATVEFRDNRIENCTLKSFINLKAVENFIIQNNSFTDIIGSCKIF
jgi:hypothetical protein